MNKWQYKLKKFKEIYNNTNKVNLDKKLIEFKKDISLLFYNSKLALDIFGVSVYKIIYIIEKYDISIKELKKLVYSLSYFFLKDYIDIKKLVKLSEISEKQLEKESKNSLELLKISYKSIENKELDINSIFDRMKIMNHG
jgi:hypothetical protein